MDRSTRMAVVPLLIMLGLQGCSANFHTVFRRADIGSDQSIVTLDAKQRAIITHGDKTCAEASPDVFAVIAQALSTGGSFSRSADPTSMQAALNVAFGTAEEGSTIPRTQTINMLRELMYRTCERTLNSDIGTLEMPIQAVRDQRLMVSILAIEQLTGTVTPRPVVVGAHGSTVAGGEAIIRLDDAMKEVAASEIATVKAQADYDALNTKTGEGDARNCDLIAKALEEGKEKDLTEEQKKLQQSCADASTRLADAKAREARARLREAELRRFASTLGGSVATAVSSTAPGGLDQAANTGITDVARVVREIVGENFSDSSEILLFCIRSLNPEKLPPAARANLPAIQSRCVEMLQARLQAEEGKQAMLASQAQEKAARAQLAESETTQRTLQLREDLFRRSWPLLRNSLSEPSKRTDLSRQLRGVLPPEEAAKADCFAGASTEARARECFLALPGNLQRKLVTPE